MLADTGHELEIIDEDEEARLAWVGALNALDEPWEGEVGVVDVGGGSTEVVVGSIGNGIHFSHSYKLGSGRLTDLCIEHDPPRPFELERVRRIIDETLPAIGEIPQPQHASAVAGSASNLRRLVGPLLDVEALERAVRILCEHPSRRIARRFELEQERVRIMPAGALILHALRGAPGRAAVVLQGRYPRGGRARHGRRASRSSLWLMAPASTVELGPGEPLRVAARRVIAARSEDLAGIAPGAVGSSDPEALHDVRVAVRRLTSALDVFADGLEEEARRRARRMLRRDAEPLGRARDLDVQIALVRRFLKGARTSEQAGISHVLDRARERARRGGGRVDVRNRGARRPRVARGAGRGLGGVKASRVKGLRPGSKLGGAAQRIAKQRVADLLAFDEAVRDPANVRELHDLRIAAKRLRYTLEVLGAVLGPAAGVVEDEARALQDLLGEVHDCDVLAPRLEAELAKLWSPRMRRPWRRWPRAIPTRPPRVLRDAPGRADAARRAGSRRRCGRAAGGALRAVPRALGRAARGRRAHGADGTRRTARR